MDQKLALAISKLAAGCLNSGELGGIAAKLASLFPVGATAAEKTAALALTPIYALAAEQPGYPEDGRPGYLPCDADLKAAVLHEIDAMIEADFDKEEHRQTWQTIRKNVAAAPERDFLPGVAVNCPDNYLLTLDKYFVSEALRRYNALPVWHQA